MTEKKNKLFTKKVLNAWLRLHKKCNHHDWLSMLEKLTKRDFHRWSFSVAGEKEMGFVWKPIATETPY